MAGINSVIIVFIIIIIGFICESKKIWPDETNRVISSIIMNIGAPALAVFSFTSYFTKEMLTSSIVSIALIFTSIMIVFLTGHLISCWLGLDKYKKAVFKVMFTFTNTIFIGLPINEIVFGSESLPYVFIYFAVSITLFWTLGIYTIRNESESENSRKKIGIFSKIMTPGLAGVLVGFILVSLQVQLDLIFSKTLSYLGNVCIPLALLMIGSNLAKSSLGKIRILKPDVIIIILSKLIVGPLIMYLVLRIGNITGIEASVYIMISAMPCHVQSAIMAEYYKVEGEYASELVAITTILTIVYVPIYALLLN